MKKCGAGLQPAAGRQPAWTASINWTWRRERRRGLKACPTILLITFCSLNAATPRDCQVLQDQRRWQEANNCYRDLVASEPTNPDYRVAWGRLFEQRYNPAEATKLFQEALKIDPKNARAYLGLAMVASNDFDIKAVEFAKKALELAPTLTEAQELLARFALEDNNEPLATEQANKALRLSPQSPEAVAVLASIDLLDGKSDSAWISKMNGEGWATAGHFLVINRRYEEGIAAYRKAIALDPKLDDARAELGVNLMRLGHDDEARQQLTECYEHGWRNAETVNSLRLLDSYKNFVTFREGNIILRLHTKEAALLRPYFEAEMQRAIATYERKYQMKLPGPVQVEVYPDHEDFAVRTMGLPGLGALGVTFGTVIDMDSPSGRTPGEFHWGATLWHEMSHVYVLTATHHLVPRWYTEGLAVHEETAASGSPDWGDPLEPEAIEAIRAKKLLPVAELDRGFVRPEYPGQVQVSYYQAGRICDFISEKWGEPMLLTMVHSFAVRTTTDQVIRKDLGIAPEEFDKQFMAWLDASTHTAVAHFDEWKQQMRALHEAAQSKNNPDQIRRAQAVRDLYPQFVQPGNPYVLLAVAYLATGDKGSARRELESYVARGGRNPSEIRQLASLQVDAGEPKQAAATLERLLYIYPEDEELHRKLGSLLLDQNETDAAIREYQAVLAMKPLDTADAHYQLARAYRAANRIDAARDEVLLALEAAPDYKPAQKLLLEITR